MSFADRWLLPEGIEEILPAQAYKLENLRRQLLDLYASWGYEYVITPLIEFLDSLLIGSGSDLDLQTFKITDQLTGRMMGLRADITPQVARIDAHSMQHQGPTRLCYAGSVLHTRPHGMLASRSPISIGAELYGHQGIASDIEIITLMIETLNIVQIKSVHLALGHVGIYRALVQQAALSSELEKQLFAALQSKSEDEIRAILQASKADDSTKAMLQSLPQLSGGEEVIKRALKLFKGAAKIVCKEIEELQAIAAGVKQRFPQLELYYDLSELRGYQYHTGIVFAAYCPAYGRAIAKGGRYDDIGKVFGRARAATGFDANLKTLTQLSQLNISPSKGILVPASDDDNLLTLVTQLRQQGERVVNSLGESDTTINTLAKELSCDRIIVNKSDQWVVEYIDEVLP